MNWERVASARAWARLLLAIPWLGIAFLVFAWVPAPSFTGPYFGPPGPVLTISGIQSSRVSASGIPIDIVPRAVGLLAFLIGYAWMWRLYRAPTKYEGAHWRFHDH